MSGPPIDVPDYTVSKARKHALGGYVHEPI
jgi:hypothetical protein